MSLKGHRALKNAVALGLALVLSGAAWSQEEREFQPEAERHYRAGVGFYAEGRRLEALDAFRKALRIEPDNGTVRAAVDRVRLELSRPVDPAPTLSLAQTGEPASLEEWIDDWLLVLAPRYIRFEKTLGDAWTGQGTRDAMGGRVAQLMAERRLALVRNRTFLKDPELRALVRRWPVVEV